MDRDDKPGWGSTGEWVGALIFGAIFLAVALWSDGKVLYALGAIVLVVVALRVLAAIITVLLGVIVGRP